MVSNHYYSPPYRAPRSQSFQMARSKDIAPNVGRLSRSQVFEKRGLYKGESSRV